MVLLILQESTLFSMQSQKWAVHPTCCTESPWLSFHPPPIPLWRPWKTFSDILSVTHRSQGLGVQSGRPCPQKRAVLPLVPCCSPQVLLQRGPMIFIFFKPPPKIYVSIHPADRDIAFMLLGQQIFLRAAVTGKIFDYTQSTGSNQSVWL